MDDDLVRFRTALERDGLVGGLRVLSERTAFRYTGVYRYARSLERAGGGGTLLENVALIDRQDPAVTFGPGVPMVDAYCDYLGSHGDELEFADIACQPAGKSLARKVNNPALAYCGVVIRDAVGKAVGSLCYYDTRVCQPRPADLPLLRAAARLIAPMIG